MDVTQAKALSVKVEMRRQKGYLVLQASPSITAFLIMLTMLYDYQVWVQCPLCGERYLWLLYAMTFRILVKLHLGCERIQIQHAIIYSTTIHRNCLRNKLVFSQPSILVSRYIHCASILDLKAQICMICCQAKREKDL